MNGPSSDESENVIDVFVMSRSTTDAPVRPEHLEQKGYHVTLFSDRSQLLETLRYGKPNLLVCDSLTMGQDAYEFCRQIKADPGLWMIPVLVVTTTSSFSDLLHVLDCNADNFIAAPFETPYLISLIDVMLVTPVEQPRPEQITTQFKIRHDEQDFVVMADRRKLLEFLLSSFEIVVNKSGELDRAFSEITTLSGRIRKAEESGSEQERIIGILNENLGQREGAISTLNDELRKKATETADLIREKQFLLGERDEYKARIAAADDAYRALVSEKEELARGHERECGGLHGQIEELTGELSGVKADLAAAKQALALETTRCEDAETMLAELEPQKEQAEKSLRTLTLECEQLKTSCIAERNRAVAAGQEIKSLMQAKQESEQDLTHIIDELKGTAKQQAEEVIQLRNGRAKDRDQIGLLESRLTALADEKERAGKEAERITAGISRDLALAKEEVASLRTALGERDTAIAGLNDELGTARNEAAGLKTELRELNLEIAGLNRELDATRNEVTTQKTELDAQTRDIAGLESALEKESAGREKAESGIAALESRLAQAQDEIHKEREEHAAEVAALKETLHEHNATLASLQGAHAEARTNLDTHRGDLAQARQELASVVEERATVKVRLDEAVARIRSLEAELEAARGGRGESEKKIRTLEGEIGQVKETLEAERRERSAATDRLRDAAREQEEALKKAREETERISALLATEKERAEKEHGCLLAQMESERASFNREQERLVLLLQSEQDKVSGSEEHARAETGVLSQRVEDLSAGLAAASERIQSLLAMVATLEREKHEAEEKTRALADEIDQARTALADEWEDHMTDNERLTAASGTMAPPATAGRPAAPHHAPEPAAPPVIIRTTNLPAEIHEEPRALAAVPAPSAEKPAARTAAGVEDLFEDLDASSGDEEGPQVTIVRDPDVDTGSIPFAGDPGDSCEPFPAPETRAPDLSGSAGEYDDLQDDDTEVYPPAGGSFPASAPIAYSFDRTQWFDLLKWAHQSGALSQEQRLQIVRMGRLVQKGRRLTRRQDEQVRDILSLVQSLGYRFS